MQNHIPSHLSDDQLTIELDRLARCAREATATLVAHLAEFDERRLYRGAGFQSLFAYCTQVLRLSEHGAYNRIEATRAVRQFPVVLEMLTDGSVNLATVRILAPHLTRENHRLLLEAARGRSKREVQALVAGHFPQPAVPPLVRKLPLRTAASAPSLDLGQPLAAPRVVSEGVASIDPGVLETALARTTGADKPAPSSTSVADDDQTSTSTGAATPLSAVPSVPPTVRPLAADRYLIRFTATAETHQKLRQAQDLLGHSVPTGDLPTVFDLALSALLCELVRKKVGAADRPRAPRPGSAGSRHIPAHVRRAVWERDGGVCAFVASDGRRCSGRRFLEFHHVHPYGAGGEATVGNIELRCRTHNAYEAELFYGGAADNQGGPVSGAQQPRVLERGHNSPRGELGDNR
jgi:hypothetical protein